MSKGSARRPGLTQREYGEKHDRVFRDPRREAATSPRTDEDGEKVSEAVQDPHGR